MSGKKFGSTRARIDAVHDAYVRIFELLDMMYQYDMPRDNPDFMAVRDSVDTLQVMLRQALKTSIEQGFKMNFYEALPIYAQGYDSNGEPYGDWV